MTDTEATRTDSRRRIAIVGTGISGLSAAWLLSQRHDVTVFEAADRIGGHTNTVTFDTDNGPVHVDTGFIVYNEWTYPNLTALFRTLGVPTAASNMSFAVSLDNGGFEYSGGTGLGLLAQKRNALSPRFWSMIWDLLRFYRNAPRDLHVMGDISLDEYLTRNRYGSAFREDHLYPMAAAIWSTPAMEVGRYPAAHFIKFCRNHGLLLLRNRPVWRTVVGGAREYVKRLTAPFADNIRLSTPVTRIRRLPDGVEITTADNDTTRFDDVVIATHADQALAMLADANRVERRILGAFTYTENRAVLHTDSSFMPRRRAAWSSWNYVADSRIEAGQPSITYWMNRLQPLGETADTFVTLNPAREPDQGKIIAEETYHHPVFDARTEQMRRELWALQGLRNTWLCGSYFGSGFHEDGLQAGLAVAEDLGGLSRPWKVADDSGRIVRLKSETFAKDTRLMEATA